MHDQIMWMMGYSDGGHDINTIQDPFSGRKLRPLMPRPINPPNCLTRIHGADLLTLNHHLAMAEQNKRDLTTQQVVVSSRWNPTPEQLHTLEELYRRGTRTPSADQIQHITAQLRRYGKIEGKNVFYWFQNHKARERQKRRRQLESLSDEQPPHNNNSDNADRREAGGANRTVFEVEQTKNWASPSNSSTLAEKSGEAEAECKADGWVQFDEDAESQRRRNATWRMMNLSCSSSPTTTTNLIINPSSSSSAPTTLTSTLPSMDIKLQDHSINLFFQPHIHHSTPHHHDAAQTLQLFPLRSAAARNDGDEDDDDDSGAAINSTTTLHVTPPYQFFEFLPLKN